MYYHFIVILLSLHIRDSYFSPALTKELPHSVISYRAENHKDLATLKKVICFRP